MQKKIISYVLIKNGPIEDHYQDVELSDGVFLDGITKMGGVFLIIPLAGQILVIKFSTIMFPLTL